MRASRTVFAVVLALLLAAGCATERTTGRVEEFAVTGYAHAGPVCPVQQEPPDPACADRPVAGAVLLVLDDAGDTIGEIRTDANGRFESRLPAGNYTLVPQPVEGLLGTAPSQTFSTGPGLAPALDVPYNTGIR
jgi:hypothetical protein